MILDLKYTHTNYEKQVKPFLKNGVIIDTSVLKEVLEGLVETEISKKENEQFQQLLLFFDLLKINNNWEKFIITPHILTETCTHLRNRYDKWTDGYKKVISITLPLLKKMNELQAEKNKIIDSVEIKNPVLEVGDISIYLSVADNFINSGKKITILSNDGGINEKYQYNDNVMVIDYKSSIIYQ